MWHEERRTEIDRPDTSLTFEDGEQVSGRHQAFPLTFAKSEGDSEYKKADAKAIVHKSE